MTEAEWRLYADPAHLLRALGDRASERKLRLFGAAACRRIWALMLDARCRAAVEASEQFAENSISERQLDNLSACAEEAWDEAIREPQSEEWTRAANVAHAASYASSPSLSLDVLLEAIQAAAAVSRGGAIAEELTQANLLRDIFGNPFRPVAIDPSWLTDTVVQLACGIYDERAFERMPILADALQDAGCDNADVLDHCRGPGPHVRGCWVVDLLLGKS